MKTHTTEGAEDAVDDAEELAAVIPIVRNHHERWDGNGYPDRLDGEEIPLMARIVAVVDTFDAMTTRSAVTAKRERPKSRLQRFSGCRARNSIRIARPHSSRSRRRSSRRCEGESDRGGSEAAGSAPTSTDTPSTGTTPGLPKLKSDSQSSLSATNRTAIDVGPPPVSNGSGSFHTSSKRI